MYVNKKQQAKMCGITSSTSKFGWSYTHELKSNSVHFDSAAALININQIHKWQKELTHTNISHSQTTSILRFILCTDGTKDVDDDDNIEAARYSLLTANIMFIWCVAKIELKCHQRKRREAIFRLQVGFCFVVFFLHIN